VQVLRRVWVQQYYRVIDEHGEKVIWREAGLTGQGLPPGRSRIISPYDLDARYSEKRGKPWRGYKVHLSETCSRRPPAAQGADSTPPAAPNLITNVVTTEAAVPDAVLTEPVHDMLAASGLLPGEHAADAGYASADLLLDARARGITLLAPLAAGTSPPSPRRRLHRPDVRHRLGPPESHLPPRRPQPQMGHHPAGETRSLRRRLPRRHLPGLPGPG
jgi:hypothetical protein